jgi:hypothetical protein
MTSTESVVDFANALVGFFDPAFPGSNPVPPATQFCDFGSFAGLTENSRHSVRYLVPTRSLAPTNSHFRDEKREFRRVVSVRDFSISVFAS